METDMLNYEQASQLTGLAKGTLYSMVSKRQIPHIRITPRLVRFSRQALEDFLREREVPMDPAGPESDADQTQAVHARPSPTPGPRFPPFTFKPAPPNFMNKWREKKSK
jgi:excisionase family DNA binding protein